MEIKRFFRCLNVGGYDLDDFACDFCLAQMLAWSALLLAYAIYPGIHLAGKLILKFVAGIFFILGHTGAIQLVGVSTGGRDVFSPFGPSSLERQCMLNSNVRTQQCRT